MNRQKKSLLICGALSLVAAGALSAESQRGEWETRRILGNWSR